MSDNKTIIRELLSAVKRQVEKEQDKGIFKPKSTIRHLESSEDSTVTRQLTGLATYSKEAD